MSNRQVIPRATEDSINLTEENLQYLIQRIKAEITVPSIDVAYPVGYIYITSKSPSDGGDPNVLFPGTTWVQLPESYLYAAGSSDTVDGPNATPHGSNTRSAADLPKHGHDINNDRETSKSDALSGTISKLLSSYNASFSGNSALSGSSKYTDGYWYGESKSPNNTKSGVLYLYIPFHSHSMVINQQTDGVSGSMDIQPKHLYKYMWERTA